MLYNPATHNISTRSCTAINSLCCSGHGVRSVHSTTCTRTRTSFAYDVLSVLFADGASNVFAICLASDSAVIQP